MQRTIGALTVAFGFTISLGMIIKVALALADKNAADAAAAILTGLVATCLLIVCSFATSHMWRDKD
jgi:putative flippase GtrA